MESMQLSDLTAIMSAQARLSARLRKAGIRPTSARLWILQLLDDHQHTPIGADQIFSQLCAIDVSVSPGTIYRILHEFEQHGMVLREVETQDAKAKSYYFLACAQLPPVSYSLTCRVCARRMVLEDRQFAESFFRQARRAGCERLLASIAIEVTCNDCAGALAAQ